MKLSKFFILCDVFWRGCRGNLKLIILGSARVAKTKWEKEGTAPIFKPLVYDGYRFTQSKLRKESWRFRYHPGYCTGKCVLCQSIFTSRFIQFGNQISPTSKNTCTVFFLTNYFLYAAYVDRSADMKSSSRYRYSRDSKTSGKSDTNHFYSPIFALHVNVYMHSDLVFTQTRLLGFR